MVIDEELYPGANFTYLVFSPHYNSVETWRICYEISLEEIFWCNRPGDFHSPSRVNYFNALNSGIVLLDNWKMIHGVTRYIDYLKRELGINTVFYMSEAGLPFRPTWVLPDFLENKYRVDFSAISI